MSFLRKLINFLRKQPKNFKVLLVRGTVASFFSQLVMNFSNIYIVELGATAFQLSTIRSIGAGITALISIPAGWISDMYSVKKIMILGMIIQLLSISFFAFAQNWIWIIMAVLFATITMTLVFRTENIFIVNSLDDYSRTTSYGLRTTITQVFTVFAPTIGGILVYSFGGISVEGIRPLYFIQLIGFTVISIYVVLKLEDIERDKEVKKRDFFGHYKDMFKMGKGLKRFALFEALGAITVGMSMPFPFVYVVEFKGADSLIVGYMGTCFVLIAMFLAIPLGSIADRRGRKFSIFITRPFFYLSYLLLVFTPKGVYWLLLLAWCIRGVMMGNYGVLMTMSIEIVPTKYRGRWTGFTSLFQNLLRVPSMLLGGYLYENINPALVFLIPVAIDALVRMPILAAVPETLRRRNDASTGGEERASELSMF